MTSGVLGSRLSIDTIAAYDDGSRDPAKIARALNAARKTAYKPSTIENYIKQAVTDGDPRYPRCRIGRRRKRPRYFLEEEDAETRPA